MCRSIVEGLRVDGGGASRRRTARDRNPERFFSRLYGRERTGERDTGRKTDDLSKDRKFDAESLVTKSCVKAI